jgi:predicted HAD superfamily Cof-like phosphohydrolase
MNLLDNTKNWFQIAIPEPTERNKHMQIACHCEEFAEMLEALGLKTEAEFAHNFGDALKTGALTVATVDRKELLDALCDQLVTAVGVAHMYGLDIVEGLERVNASNYSKFVDGRALFDENGKIKKGPDYHKPNLTGLY